MKVTVIVPVYNQEKFLRKCLYSLVNQNFLKDDYEVLIINDGSTDGSVQICNYFENQYSNFTVFHQNNKGLFETRKFGLSKAKGDYICWVDADDYVEPDFLKILYRLVIQHNSDLAYCDYNFFPHKIKTKEKWFRKYNGKVDVTFVERNSQPWNKMVSKDLLDRLDIGNLFLKCFDEAYIKCLLEAKNPVYTTDHLYNYRVGQDSMSSSYKNVEHYKKFIQSSKYLRFSMDSLCKKSNYWKNYFDFRIKYYVLITMIVAANSNDKKTFIEMKKKLHNNENPLFKPILEKNFGYVKYFFFSRILDKNFYVSKFITHIVL
ncbi:glycosyltransferase family 2 protein [Limosilactobacillus sp.]|uniref:glycosyltransferase family 2 protein n=1 Tax=Limosilactobacillus sp. TaxID=2773925 RepID=UPI00345EE67D